MSVQTPVLQLEFRKSYLSKEGTGYLVDNHVVISLIAHATEKKKNQHDSGLWHFLFNIEFASKIQNFHLWLW